MVKLTNEQLYERTEGVQPIPNALVGQTMDYGGNSMASLFDAGPQAAPAVDMKPDSGIASLVRQPTGPALDMS